MSDQAPSMIDFLTEALASREFEVIPLAGDASSRKYYRVVHEERSWVLMAWEPFEDVDRYPFLSVLRHFRKHKIKVPTVNRVSASQGLILLEDLGDLTLERKFWENQDQALALPYYRMAVDELIKIHYQASEDRAAECTAFEIAFDKDKFLWEMNYGREHLLEKLAGINLSFEEASHLDRSFNTICEILDKEPKFISHRDYHSRNLMLKLGQMRVIDFQDARMGPIQYDLVSLVHDSYVDLNKEMQDQILSDYLLKASEFNSNLSLDEFRHVFQLQMIQRCFKACGSFASFFNNRKDLRYLKYIRPTLRKVAQTLENYPEHQGFLKILRDHNLLEREFDKECKPSS